MRFSLRTSVILLVFAANVAVFAAGLVWVTRTATEQRRNVETAYGELLGARLQSLLDYQGNLRSAGLLSWDRWDLFEDVIIVHLPEFGTRPGSSTRGVRLNPVGLAHRTPIFDEEGVLADIRRAATDGREVSTARGLSLPIYMSGGGLWGGCWVFTRWDSGLRGPLLQLLPWFLVSTLVLTLVTFGSVRHLVLDPVRDLARAAKSIAGGTFSDRVPERARKDELGELVRGFNAMAQQVEDYNGHLSEQVERATLMARDAEAAAMTQRRLAATGELAAGIAHEINNPLGGMLNAVEVLGREDLDPARRTQYLELVRGGLERIRGTVGRVLRLAPREAHAEPTRIAGPLGDALGLIEHRARTQEVRVVVHTGKRERSLDEPDPVGILAGLPPVLGEANELGQAILNLLVNALDALDGAEGGCIDIRVEERGAELYIAVADDGPGMTPEVLARAADLFFTTKDAGKGTGLGLAIVHNVVAAHGGRVVLAQREGGGLVVELYFPVLAT
ncbi:MAG: HAMP domain-containing histidine kinase [bacterium]|nr:HAMP domain-containing histidine kinase [bacterium]